MAYLHHAEQRARSVPMTTRTLCWRMGRLLAAALAAAALACGCSTNHGAPASMQRPSDAIGPFPVTKVVDGDTVKVRKDGRTVTVRLIGIDTPETKDPRKPVQCFGKEASAHAASLLAGQKVWLEYDSSQARVDRYGRDLAYIWLGDDLVNLAMVRDGFAHEYTYDTPYRYQRQFKAAQARAASAGIGLWSASTCAGDTTRPA